MAEVYDGMGSAARREFLVSPYTARLPGGESLRDVIRRLEPFVVDEVRGRDAVPSGDMMLCRQGT